MTIKYESAEILKSLYTQKPPKRRHQKVCDYCQQAHSKSITFQCVKCHSVLCGMMVSVHRGQTPDKMYSHGPKGCGPLLKIEPNPLSRITVEKRVMWNDGERA